jgi:hypothetical protein
LPTRACAVVVNIGEIRMTRFGRTLAVGFILALGNLTFAGVALAQANWLAYGTGGASEISVSPVGAVWIVGKGTGSQTSLTMSGTTITSPPVTPTRVAGDALGTWVVGSGNELWHWVKNGSGPGSWVQSPQKVIDIGVGKNGDVWAIGSDQRILHMRADYTFEPISGAGVRIAVDPAGNPWVVNSGGQIWHYTGSSWALLDGKAKDISIAPDGTVYIVGTTPAPGGFELLRLNGNKWDHIAGGGGVALATGPHGVYVAQDDGKVVTSTYATVVVNNPVTSIAITGTLPGIPISPAAPASPPASPGPQIVISGLPAGPPPPEPVPGKLICPIIGTGAKLELGCAFVGHSALKLAGPAPSASCTSPSFADPQNGGECWTCPNTNVRNASPISAKDACWKPVSENLSKATQVGRTGCGSGSFGDPRNGGECWSCPAGYGRTLDPVTADRACSKTIFGPFSQASFKGKIGQCTGSSFGDPIDGGTCWTCPAGYRRTLYAVTADNACAATVGTQYSVATQTAGCSMKKGPPGYAIPFRDPRNGGECWVCPIPLVRSASAVTTDATGASAACVSGGNTDRIVWQLGQYPEPGLYRFMPGLLSMALANPKAVDAFLLKRANGNQVAKRALWKSMISDPAGSAELKALIFASLLTAAKEEDPNNIVVSHTVADFESYVRARRMYVAEEAVRMYNHWLDVDAYNQYQSAKLASGMSGMSLDVIGKAATDYKGYAWSGAVPDSAGLQFVLASVALSESGDAGTMGPTVGSGPRSFELGDLEPVKFALEKSLEHMEEAGGEMANSASTLSKMATGALVIQSARGLMIGLTLVTGAMNISEGIMTMIEKDKIDAEYKNYVEEMSEPVHVKEMLESNKPDDKTSLLLFWALATSPYQASDKINTNPVQTTYLCAPNLWETNCKAARALISAAYTAAGN